MVDSKAVRQVRQRLLVLRAAYADTVGRADAIWTALRDELPTATAPANYLKALANEREALAEYLATLREFLALTQPDDTLDRSR